MKNEKQKPIGARKAAALVEENLLLNSAVSALELNSASQTELINRLVSEKTTLINEKDRLTRQVAQDMSNARVSAVQNGRFAQMVDQRFRALTESLIQERSDLVGRLQRVDQRLQVLGVAPDVNSFAFSLDDATQLQQS